MTRPTLYIALRFLLHRKRAFLLSLAGVVFGVAFFICTQAQTQGFAQRFIDSTLGSNGALVLRSRFQPLGAGLPVPPRGEAGRAAAQHRRYIEGISNAREIMRVSRQFSNVAACSPVLRGTLSARVGFENATVDLYGIDAPLHVQTTDLKKHLIEGSFDDFRDNPSAVIVGSKLASVLNVAAGESIQLLSPGGDYWRFTVAAIAHSGVAAVDSGRIYCHAKIAQTLLRKPYPATLIIYK
ncbi:MAG TPA: ABC transporter permease, partial [Chthoniobacterales bacterium]|nr:ABC transporter permease [Chthoniobacterales bacterium]